MALILGGVLAGCGDDPPPVSQAVLVCNDPVTGQCVPCPGVKVCVDPKTCLLVTCNNIGDALFSKPDAAAEATAATPDSAGEVDGAPDSGGADAEVADSPDLAEIAPELPPVDTGPDTGGCLTGTTQCAGAAVQLCVFGVWTTQKTCPNGQVCQGGACVCADPCPALNLVECLPGVPAVRTCQLTPDKCLSWSTPVACKPGETCELGLCKVPPAPCNPPCPTGQTCSSQGVCVAKTCTPACPAGQVCQGGQCVVSPTGTLGCAQVAACVSQSCQPGDDTCKKGCQQQGTSLAQSQYDALVTCGKATCKPLADQGKVNEAMLCLYTYCGGEQAACLGSGAGTCSTLNECLNACGTSSVCTSGCHAQASTSGAKDFYSLMVCLDQQCAGLGGSAQLQCAQGTCKAPFDKCFGGSGGGFLTCQGILKCSGGCTDKACASQCKAQGTPQAQSQIDAMVQCMDGKCGSFCASGGQACDQCLNTYCASQFAACT